MWSMCVCGVSYQVLYVCGLRVCVVSAVRYYIALCSLNWTILNGRIQWLCSICGLISFWYCMCVLICLALHVFVVSSVLNYDIICVQSDNVLGRQACSLLGK